jgi:GntR family transcriptional regulator, transcriptional repressor for pyruvate dehydrogenase complex
VAGGVSTGAGRRSGAPLRRGDHRGASEDVAARIQHHIEAEGLEPGDFLGREGDLSEELGVSRPTLREGLKLLTSRNLIRATKGPGGGIFVAHTAEQGMGRSLSDAIAMMLETGSASLDELLDARLVLEVPLAGRAAHRADPEVVERLRAAVHRGEASGGEREAMADADAELHRIVAAAAGNRMLEALTGWIFEVLQPSLSETLDGAIVHSAVVEQHAALLAAVEKGDPPRAERAMKDHLLYLRDVLRMMNGA